jgi:hypothetical protein
VTELNLDPLTGETGSHPVGTGVGAATGGVAGAAVGGAVGGPVGAAVGAVAGALAGGKVGHDVAESIDPTAEDSYWRTNYAGRPYVVVGHPYENYRAAYRYGWEARQRHRGRRWEEVERDLERGWESAKGSSRLAWSGAREAARDAWHRIERRLPGDADRDGR